MCGITGFIDFNSSPAIYSLKKMVAAMKHRGPNDNGDEIYTEKNCVVGFGQARLSIIDLSILGHQPMTYRQFSIVFNGEIYNYKEISFELRKLGHTFISGSDTEVILHAYEQWGEDCVHQFIGMFAFAIYDKQKGRILIFRDRSGVKPLFYYWKDGLFMFSSELKAFHEHPAFHKEVSAESVSLYFQYGFVPSPFSIFKYCHKLEPGSILTFDVEKKSTNIQKYWDILDYYKMPQYKISYKEAIDKVEELLISACNYRMVSDVPVGVFLSGGYDSTAVSAILQKERTDKIRTFTIGFEEGNNEAPFAKAISKYIGTDHTEYYCTTKEAKEIIPELSFYFDEPFSDSSAIPTILVSKAARKDVTVALSADAGDEIFGGYRSYLSLQKNINLLNKIPGQFNKLLSTTISSISKFPIGNYPLLKHELATLSEVLKIKKDLRISYLFDKMKSYSNSGMNKLLNEKYEYSYRNILSRDLFHDDISVAMAMDYKNYLQDDILTKVDRATMSVSLEGREPLLDHRLVEFAARLPIEYKYDGKTPKKILKDIVYKYIPKEMMDRPKSGFSLPINSWLKGDLKPFVEEMLSESMIRHTGFMNIQEVDRIKNQFSSGANCDQSVIWRILQFQMWYKRWMS